MVNMKTRFLDSDVGGKPHVVKVREADVEAEIEACSEMANLYYGQWVDGEMWKQFEMNTEESRFYETEQIQDSLSEECF